MVTARLAEGGQIRPPVRLSLPQWITAPGIPVKNMEMGGMGGQGPGCLKIVSKGAELIRLPVHLDIRPADESEETQGGGIIVRQGASVAFEGQGNLPFGGQPGKNSHLSGHLFEFRPGQGSRSLPPAPQADEGRAQCLCRIQHGEEIRRGVGAHPQTVVGTVGEYLEPGAGRQAGHGTGGIEIAGGDVDIPAPFDAGQAGGGRFAQDGFRAFFPERDGYQAGCKHARLPF